MKKNLLVLFASLVALVEFALGVNGKYLSYNERSSGHAYISPFDAGDDGWIFTYKPFTYVELSFLNSAVKDKERLQKLYWKLDGLLNSDGYELLAQCAFKLIEKEGWIISESPE